MSPPLVVAFALAGRVDLDLTQRADRQRQERKGSFSARSLADAAGNPRRDAIGADAGNFPQTLSRFRRSESEVERNPVQHRRSLSMGREERLHSRAAVLQRFLDGAGHTSPRFAGARPLGIFGDSVTTDHISPAGAIKATFARRTISDVARHQAGRFQQLRVATRKRSGHDARHVRQRADQKSHGAGNRRRRDQVLSARDGEGEVMSIFDAAMKYQTDGRSADDFGRPRIRNRLVARLGGERNASS